MLDQIVNFIQNIIKKLPNLEKKFPTEESRYSAVIRLAYVGSVSSMILTIIKFFNTSNEYIVRGRRVVEEPSLLLSLVMLVLGICALIASVAILYVGIYVAVKSKALKFFVKILVGMLTGGILMALVFKILGPLATFISIIIAIIANRKRLAIIKKYKQFVWYSLGINVLPYVCGIIGLVAVLIGEYTRKNGYVARVDMDAVAMCFLLLYFFMPAIVTHYALNRERAKGRKFLDTIFLMNAVPMTLFMCFLSYLTLTHINGLSGDSVFGADGTDFFVNHPLDSNIVNSHTIIDTPNNIHMDTEAINSQVTMDVSNSTHIDTSGHFKDMQQKELFNSDITRDLSSPQAAESNTSTSYTDFGSSVEVKETSSGGSYDTQFGTHGINDTVITSFEHSITHPKQMSVQDAMGQTVVHASTNPDTNKTVFQDGMMQTIGTKTVDPVTGDVTLHSVGGQSVASVTHGGAILNQLGLTEGTVSTNHMGDILIHDAQGQLINIIKSDGTVMDALHQKIGEIKIDHT